jgi:hypothetical protein
MSPWTDKLDLAGHPHTSYHRDGHRVGLGPEGEWWAYHRDHRYTPPGSPRVGPEPEGPFRTLAEAKSYVESQGFHSVFPFLGEVGDARPA